MTENMVAEKTRIFVSYSHKDEVWRERLDVHMKSLQSFVDVEYWNDTKIHSGAKWREELDQKVNSANVAICLVSADFLASDFIRENELPPLLYQAERKQCLIISIILKPCLFYWNDQLARFQAANAPSLPLVNMTEGESEKIFVEVCESIINNFKILNDGNDKKIKETKTSKLTEDFFKNKNLDDFYKIGDWVYDKDNHYIVGSSENNFLLSKKQYHGATFEFLTSIRFTNFEKPDPERRKLGFNAGLVFGFQHTSAGISYYNILITGTHILLEAVGFDRTKPKSAIHLTKAMPLDIEDEKTYHYKISKNDNKLTVFCDEKEVLSYESLAETNGHIGIRPWRSVIYCERFEIKS